MTTIPLILLALLAAFGGWWLDRKNKPPTG